MKTLIPELRQTYHIQNMPDLYIHAARLPRPRLNITESEIGRFFDMELFIEPHSFADNFTVSFAHEYTHFVINSKGRSMPEHTLWFEEALCHCASLFFFHKLKNNVATARYLKEPGVRVPVLQEYLHIYEGIHNSLQNGEGIANYLHILTQQGGNPPYFSAIVGTHLYQFFYQNPNLWNMLNHFAHVPSESSLEALFENLQQTADDSYRGSLDQMIHFLFPRS